MVLCSGEACPYDVLFLCTGGVPRFVSLPTMREDPPQPLASPGEGDWCAPSFFVREACVGTCRNYFPGVCAFPAPIPRTQPLYSFFFFSLFFLLLCLSPSPQP